MSDYTVRVEKTCPACEGRGKSYGNRYCGYCRGSHQITETVTLEEVNEEAAKGIVDQIAEALAD